MHPPRQLGFLTNLTVVWARRSGLHHGIENFLVLAHYRYGCDLHAHVVQGFGILEPDTVFLCEGTADRYAENLGLNRP